MKMRRHFHHITGKLKDNLVSPTKLLEGFKKSSACKNTSGRCKLCLEEKLAILSSSIASRILNEKVRINQYM